MPSEGLLKVICSESSIRKSTKGASLWLTLTVSEGPSNGYKVYTYVSLPTPEAAQKTTKFGTLAEFFEKQLKAALVAFGHSSEGIKALTGNQHTAQDVLGWVQGRPANVYYRPPVFGVEGSKHQVDFVNPSALERVRSGEIVFQDRRLGAGADSSPVVAPMMSAPTSGNGMMSPQPVGGMVIDGLIQGASSVTL